MLIKLEFTRKALAFLIHLLKCSQAQAQELPSSTVIGTKLANILVKQGISARK